MSAVQDQMPAGASVKQLAHVWKVSSVRVYQLLSEGRLRRLPGSKLIDYRHAMNVRQQQISDRESQVLFTAHGNNRTDRALPKAILLAGARSQAALTDDQVLGIAPVDED